MAIISLFAIFIFVIFSRHYKLKTHFFSIKQRTITN